ncbi:MAG: putative Ig domain-containing protein [Nostoc sp.]|uniref:putative Ig domain-containing protein n=1 Tax=Nostoc sp. TaxID=1180 RepID=UPI002FFD4D49
MGSSENLVTNSASSTNGGILPLSLLDSASLSAALDDDSALTSLQIKLRTPNGSDPISSEFSRQEKLTTTTNDLEKFKSSVDSSNKRNNPVNYLNNYSPLFKNQQNSSLIPSQQSEIIKSNNKTGFDQLIGVTSNTPLINIGTSDPVVGNVNNSLSIPSLLTDILPPTLSATVLPLNLLPGSPQARLVGIVNGTGSAIASLTVAFDNLAAGPISVSPLGAFDHALDFTGLNDGPHTFTVKATDVAGNFSTASFSLTVNLAPTPPTILATLAHDTAPDGTTNTDGITFDPTTTGTVKVVNRGIFINALTTVTPIINAVANVSLTETNQIVSLKAGFDNAQVANYLNVIADLHSDGSFTLSRNRLNTIFGGTLPDGHYTLHLQAVDKYNVANNFDISFTLDTTTAVPTINLSANSDTGLSNSDRITLDTTPTIVGTAEAFARVQLFNNGQLKGQTTATLNGTWQITTSELTDGVYGLNAIATDIAGNTKTSAAIDVTVDSALPQVNLSTPVNQSDLYLGDKLTGTVDGTGSAVTALSYRFDNLQNVSLNFNANGRFDQVLDFTGLNNGEHTLTITATDTAGNIKTSQYAVTVIIDRDAPVISASLLHDTAPNGQTNSDRITFDPTITGTVIDASRVVEFKAGFDNTLAASFTNVTAFRNADGSFTFDRNQLETIYGGTLPDGFHTMHLQAVDEFHNTSNIFDFSFTFDSTTSEPIFNLNAMSDSGVVGDFQTKFDTVTLTGLAEANSTVVLEQTGAVTTSDNNGQFTFAHVSLATGDNSFIARSTDIAGNQNTYSINIYRFSPPTAINLTGNTVAENSSTGIVIGQLSSVDPDPDDTYTYILEDNAGGRFRIVGNQLQVADGTLLNFESTTQHSVTVTSTDANGLSLTKVFAIAVTNVNEAPTFLTTPIVTANSASLYTYNIIAADPDAGDNLRITTDHLPSWLTLVDNLDGTATLRGTPKNFLDNINSNIHLKVTDASGLTAIQDFTIAPTTSFTENNNFAVSRSLSLTIPATPSYLSFKINPQFDTTAVNSINDAIDVALVDANGNSLVHTVGSGRDAFFNWTEGESTALGVGTSYDAATGTVSLNLTGITPGTNAQLVFRLVNDDGDVTTSVRITDFAFRNAPDGTQAAIQTDFTKQTSQTTAPNFNLLTDVGSSIGTEYHRTSFNADTHLLYADITLRNIGSYSVDSPLIVAVNHLSDPTVLVRNPDGFTPDGVPYYDFSKLVGDRKFDPNELTNERSLIFYNPKGVQFTYDLTVLAQLNTAPVIQTQANKEVIVGHHYTYDVDATDPNGDSLTYKLLVAPDGMTIDQTTGLISWNTSVSNTGNQAVFVEVNDGRGGITQQQYSLSVIDAPPNRPPVFTSTPVVDAAINTSYTYQANASDADDDFLAFSLLSAPQGMTVDANTGVVSWIPTVNQLGTYDVTLAVTDGKGGTAQQAFKVQTQAQAGNHAPIIISTAETTAYTATGYTYRVEALDPDRDSLTYSLVTAPTGMTIDASTGQILWTTNSSNTGTYNITVEVLDAQGAKDTQNFTLNVSGNLPGQIWGRVSGDRSNLQTTSYSPQSITQPITGNRLPASTIPLTQVVQLPQGFYSSHGIEYYEAKEQILVSDAGSTRTTSRLNLVQPDGTLVPFSNVTQDVGSGSSGVAITSLNSFTTVAEGNLGGFTAGDIFGNAGFAYSSFGYDPNITKITDGGATIIPRWATLPTDLNYRAISFKMDTTGIFGGDLIVQSDTGVDSRGYFTFRPTLFRVKADGTVSTLATLDNDYGGNFSFDIVPNDVARYGPLAGKIIVANRGGFSTVDVAGNVQFTPFEGAGSIHLIRPNENLFAESDYTHNPRILYGTPASYFQPMVGDFLINNGSSRMYWDGQALRIERLNILAFADLTFAPVGINNIAPVNPVSLADWTVYIDKNNNGRRDSDELFTKTDANGIYSFTLPVGNYTVAEELPGGWSQTIPPSSQAIQVSLSSGQTITGVDFSNTKNDTAPQENHAPHFTSFAPTQAIADQSVVYRPSAFDPDGDVLSYDLLVKPDGMVVDPNTGIIAWHPTSEQVGTQDVIVRVRDAKGALDLQSFQIQVGSAQTPPLFTALPKPGSIAALGVPFQFQIQARNPLLDPITFELTTNASGAVIDPTTGLFKWTPTAVGTYNFTLTANDGKGGKTTQSFQLQALANVPNDAPFITSQPPKASSLAFPYVYTIRANDPNNDPLNYSLVTAPAGMTLDNQGNLFWQPTASQVGQNSVVIKVSDGRGGEVTQSFDINIVSSATIANHTPRITSTPVSSAVVNKLYQSELKVSDSDNDLLLVSLDKAPDGMFIDPQTSILRWTPTANQLGDASVIVRVQDSHGAFDLLSFTVNVRLVNTPPLINSTPGTQAATRKLYKYLVQASDIDTDSLIYNLVNAPDGMTIDPQSGLIQWTPASNQLGQQDITVAVNDGLGGIATQNYTIQVSATLSNFAPIINSTPIYLAAVGSTYQYQMQATDPDADDTLTYQLISGPTDMTINSTTGLLTWLSPVSGNYKVVLEAVDSHGESATQAFTLTARENHAPVIKSNPLLTATPGSAYAYDIIASDADSDRLTYILDQASRNLGMTLDTLGRLRWTPTAGNVGSHTVVVTVNDGNGKTGQQQYNLSVAADTEAPKVRLIANYDLVNLGESITFQARATDNTKVAGLQLLIDGTAVVLDSNGMATFTPTIAGTIIAKAIATDAAGNPGEATFSVVVIDPSDVNAPDVSLNLGAIAQGTVTAPVEIKGTVSDDNLDYYRLLVAPIGSSDFKEIFRGTSTVNNDVLGKFDPSLLENDSYTLRLEAHDKGGNVSFVEDTVNVSGELKLGNFRLSFTDLSIPVTGIPITLTRTYDSLTSGSTDDFGYGWRMEFRDTDLRTSVGKPSGEVAELGGQNPFKDGTKVYVTLPGGKREGFTFKPTIDPLSQYLRGAGSVDSDPNIYHPSFVADAGVTDTLTVQNTRIIHGAGTNQYYGLGGSAYNPADSYYGGVYTLTTKEGIVYQIDAATGDLLTVTDTNGNKLTYTDADITSSTGQKITFGRDAQGRIATVTDPAGKQIHYQYNAQGDLVSVTDREGNTTRMEYDEQRSHYLDKIIDPLGRTGIKNEYGDDGRLKYLEDVNGQKVEMSYDPANLVQTIKDALGNSTTYEYDERGNIVTEVDALGGITRRTFDEDNNLLSETTPEGRTTRFTYDERGNKLSVTNPLGSTTKYTYNSLGQKVSTVDSLGNVQTNTYDRQGNLLSFKSATGSLIKSNFDPSGRQVSLIGADGSVTEFNYDSSGNVINQIDASGNEIQYTYDANGKLLSEAKQVVVNGELETIITQWTYDLNGKVISMTDPVGNTTRYEYDHSGNLSSIIDSMNRKTRYIYDGKGQLIESINPDGTSTKQNYDVLGRKVADIDELDRITRFTYDALGRLVETILPDNTPEDLADNPKQRTEYNHDGLITTEIDPRGNRTEYVYDLAGRVTLSRDALGNETTYTYNSRSVKLSETDALGRTTRFVFDEAGRQIKTIFADTSTISNTYNAVGLRDTATDQAGRTTHYEYNSLHRLVETILPDSTPDIITDNPRIRWEYDQLGRVTAQIDPSGLRTEYSYDEASRLVSIRDQRGEQTFTYDAVGNRISETDALGRTTQFIYNAMNHLVETRFPDGSKTRIIYDAVGNINTKTDELGRQTQFTYDAQNHLTGVIDALNQQTEYGYDLAGNLIRVKDANNNINSYEYDALNRRTTTILPLGQRSETTYDVVGNLLTQKDFNGNTTRYEYNLLNRLVTKSFPDNTVVLYSYTPTGQVLTTTDSNGLTNYTYDTQDRLLSRTDPDGRTISYTYDIVGNPTSVTTPGSKTLYNYDQFHRLSQVIDLNGNSTQYTYDAVNNLTRTELPNGTFEVREYDLRNRLNLIEQHNSNSVIASYRYTLDLAGNRTQIVEQNGRESSYNYDLLNRLIQEAITDPVFGNLTNSFTYDPVGNRLTQNSSTQGLTTYSYDANDRLLSETHDGVATSYSYDNNGNTLSRSNLTEQVSYQWDFENHLLAATTTTANGIKQVQYRYNPDGVKVATTVDGVETRYLVDTNLSFAQVLEEYGIDGEVQASYVFGHDLISQKRGDTISYYHTDALGSIRLITNTSGQVTDSYVYDAYGNILGSTGNTVNSYGYTGEQFDQNLGEYYLRARYYNPSTGRFTARDPFAGLLDEPLSLAKYPYVHGNPVNFTDPSGLFAEDGLTTIILQGILAAMPSVSFTTALTLARVATPIFIGAALVASYALADAYLATDADEDDYNGLPIVFFTDGDLPMHRRHINFAQTGFGFTKSFYEAYHNGQPLPSSANPINSVLTYQGIRREARLDQAIDINNDNFRRREMDKALVGRALGIPPEYISGSEYYNIPPNSYARDEYPFATTEEGGPIKWDGDLVSIDVVTKKESDIQGKLLKKFYKDPGVMLEAGTPLGIFGVLTSPVKNKNSGFIRRNGTKVFLS